MNTDRFCEIANQCGARVWSAVLLGPYLHIDTNQASEPKIREILGIMKAKEITVLKPGRDGRHIDGSSHHRIVAKFV
jgi:hypothetical protein